MLIKNIPKNTAEKLKSAIADLRPGINVRIDTEDYNLYQLGFVRYIPCSVEIGASEEEINELVDEVIQMEVDAWGFDNNELKNRETAKRQKELENRYRKYEIIYMYLGT